MEWNLVQDMLKIPEPIQLSPNWRGSSFTQVEANPGILDSSDGKESACNAGNPGLIPG